MKNKLMGLVGSILVVGMLMSGCGNEEVVSTPEQEEVLETYDELINPVEEEGIDYFMHGSIKQENADLLDEPLFTIEEIADIFKKEANNPKSKTTPQSAYDLFAKGTVVSYSDERNDYAFMTPESRKILIVTWNEDETMITNAKFTDE